MLMDGYRSILKWLNLLVKKKMDPTLEYSPGKTMDFNYSLHESYLVPKRVIIPQFMETEFLIGKSGLIHNVF